MPSMAKVNNRVINYRDFSFSLRNNFINEYLVLLLSFWREILSRNNDSWTRDRSLTRITLSQMGKKAGNSNVDPATWPNKMEKENNGGLTSDLYLQNNAVSFFFSFFFSFRCSFFPSTRGQKPRCSIFFLIPASWCLSFTRCPPRRASFDERSSFVPRGIIVKWVCKDFNHHVYTCLIAVFFFSCIRRILSSNFP